MEKLIILGCGSALPASGRNPTSQVLEHNGKYFLIDCGEGTQSRLRENKLSFDKITHIFISHLHGDHYLGLPGLISSMQLLGRTKDLNLYGPPGLWDILELQFKLSNSLISFPIKFHPVEEESELMNTESLIIRSIELNHRIRCFGFIFFEKEKPRRINGEAVKNAEVPHFFMENLRKGDDFINTLGRVYANSELTFSPKKSHVYAFCSDNRIKNTFHEKIKDVTILYHESTFLHSELARAKRTFHTTAKEAAELALKIKPDLLVLSHYSARYTDIGLILAEAKKVYPKSILAKEKLIVDFSKV